MVCPNLQILKSGFTWTRKITEQQKKNLLRNCITNAIVCQVIFRPFFLPPVTELRTQIRLVLVTESDQQGASSRAPQVCLQPLVDSSI